MTMEDEHRALAAEVARAMARGFALAIVGQEYKTVKSVVGDYAVTLTTPVAALFNGSGSINTVRATFNRAPKEYARDAYVEGLIEGKLEESDLDSDDEKVIAEWLAVQAGAVGGVVDAIREASKAEGDSRTGAQRGAFTRVGYWVDALAQLGALARARALDGVMAYWELGDTETIAKWRNQSTRNDGRTALCVATEKSRNHLVGECKLDKLPGIATDLESLIMGKFKNINSDSPLWMESWN